VVLVVVVVLAFALSHLLLPISATGAVRPRI
jgi:hypothetical protein